MSRYTVIMKLSMVNENGATLSVGSIDNLNEGGRLAQQMASQMGHRGPIYVTILDTQNQSRCVHNISTFS